MVELTAIIMCLFTAHAQGMEWTLAFYASNRSSSNLGYWKNVGAVYMAVEDATRDGLFGNHSIRILWGPDGCSTAKAAGQTAELIHTEDIHGIIGAGCSTSTTQTGFLASYFNIPVLPMAAVDPILGDKVTYDTLIRVLPPFNKLGHAVAEIIVHYGWKKIVIISQTSGLCYYAANGLKSHLPKDVTVADWLHFLRVRDPVTNLWMDISDAEIMRLLGVVKRKARVIYLCMPETDETNFFLRAHEENMTSSDYVWLTSTRLPLDPPIEQWKKADNMTADRLKAAMRHRYQLSMSINTDVGPFYERQRQRMMEPPLNISNPEQPSKYSMTLYDSVYLFALAMNKTLEEGGDPHDGRALVRIGRNIVFNGISGTVAFDEQADRQPIYNVHTPLEGVNDSVPWGRVDLTHPRGQRFEELMDIWDTPDGRPPPDTPPCGFYDELCHPTLSVLSTPVLSVIILVGCLLTVVVIVSLVLYRKHVKRMERELMKWKISFADLDFMTGGGAGSRGMMSSTQRLRASAASLVASTHSGGSQESKTHQLFAKVAMYQGQLVAVKDMTKTRPSMSKAELQELKTIRDLHHENVNPLIGVCVDPGHVCQVTTYCTRGSLQDILETDEIAIDKSFKQSFIVDIAKGLAYIHKSPIRSVGNLKSSNCVLDSRWTVKITDILTEFLRPLVNIEAGEHQLFSAKLWTAPELLRQSLPPARGTQSGDVYSLGVVIQETLYRSLPYFMHELSPKEIVSRVIAAEDPPYRPKCPSSTEVHPGFVTFLGECWNEDPSSRPNVHKVIKSLPAFFDEQTTNLVDRVVKKLESYAENLESIVKERTGELLEEKKRSDNLLSQMLPVSVVERLKLGQRVDPELYDEATIYFSDVVDFVTMATTLTPEHVVTLLNDLYAMIDNIVARHDAYKVETISDSYVVASGLPLRNGHAHIAAVADMSLDIMSASLDFCVENKPDVKVRLRVGIHTGPCCAGVVGLSMPRYCIFGDTVNTASRMESNGLGSRIHLSQDAYSALGRYQGYKTSKRGQLFVKGKGLMDTFWLNGKAGFTRPLPVECADTSA